MFLDDTHPYESRIGEFYAFVREFRKIKEDPRYAKLLKVFEKQKDKKVIILSYQEGNELGNFIADNVEYLEILFPNLSFKNYNKEGEIYCLNWFFIKIIL